MYNCIDIVNINVIISCNILIVCTSFLYRDCVLIPMYLLSYVMSYKFVKEIIYYRISNLVLEVIGRFRVQTHAAE